MIMFVIDGPLWNSSGRGSYSWYDTKVLTGVLMALLVKVVIVVAAAAVVEVVLLL